MAGTKDVAALKLAVYLHDPPWKPWGIRRSGYAISGCSKEYDACIAEKFAKEFASADSKSVKVLLEKLGLKESLDNNLAEKLAAGLRAAAKVAEDWGKKDVDAKAGKSHERQSLLLLKLLEAFLGGIELKEYMSIARKSYKALLDAVTDLKDRSAAAIRLSDKLASSFDRNVLSVIDEKAEDVNAQVYLNILNPYLGMSINREIEVEKIIEYMAALLVTVGLLLNRTTDSSPLMLYNIVYSFVEPLWYIIVGWRPPVADTRVPHHTVFDHASAAAMVSNWFLETCGRDYGPDGCLAIVDLASVQQWIGEARRLRDAWAASWLASWLAWKSIEPFVEELGPDVLVQPPARLHPFYSSMLLSKLGCEDTESDAICRWAAEALGLRYGWPLDPTVPSRVLIALPHSICSRLEEVIEKAYQQAWRELVKGLAEYVAAAAEAAKLTSIVDDNFCSRLRNGVEQTAPEEAWKRLLCFLRKVNTKELKELLTELEPPLPLRIEIRCINEAKRKLSKILNINCDKEEKHGRCVPAGLVPYRELESLLLYQVLSDGRLWQDTQTGLRSTGRRSGQGYFNYAKKLHGEKAFLNCHVCGIAAAIVDGEMLNKILKEKETRQARKEVLDKIHRLASNLHGERLCPYCLAKRVLRDMLYRDNLAKTLTGLSLPGKVYERLGRVTVDAYTARTRLARSKLVEAIERIVGDPSLVLGVIAVARLGLTAPNKFLEKDEEENILKRIMVTLDKIGEEEISKYYAGTRRKNVAKEIAVYAQAVVLEAVHNYAFIDKKIAEISEPLADFLKKLANDSAVRSVRRRYAIVASDGDRMGSGILSGYLGFRPDSYAEKVLMVKDKTKTASIYRMLVAGYEQAVALLTNSEPNERTVIVTPSYHFSVSRALAAQAVMDRDIVEGLGGFFLYSGGDDAIAILPPADYSKSYIAYPALAAAYAMRRSYWGVGLPLCRDEKDRYYRHALMLEETQNTLASELSRAWIGFTFVPMPGRDPRHGGLLAVPALAVYGRSTVIYYVDTKKPLWKALHEAHAILEAKDYTLFMYHDYVSEKDALYVASDASGLAVLPLSRGKHPTSTSEAATAAAILHSVAALLAFTENHDEKLISTSVYNDARGYIVEAIEAALNGDALTIELLVKHILKRNSGEAVKRLGKERSMRVIEGFISEAAENLADASAVSIVLMKGHGYSARAYLMDGYSLPVECTVEERDELKKLRECTRSMVPPLKKKYSYTFAYAGSCIFHVFNAARITRNSK
ncbi:type III-B CRISPR-associated protein Cas10/Cmr2 [Pyrodictium abyssi]|uniref:Type III-B CRISPR-associated protein Cas10/Cmr2 n=1 Tax=Pyrodictium abyssi TaxID=54256 RepID=A0ABM8IVX9_9CREN|nr:type III-B CRISPR-associated protein Cas10/Cmr2 [Pyrodictium abyssi]